MSEKEARQYLEQILEVRSFIKEKETTVRSAGDEVSAEFLSGISLGLAFAQLLCEKALGKDTSQPDFKQFLN